MQLLLLFVFQCAIPRWQKIVRNSNSKVIEISNLLVFKAVVFSNIRLTLDEKMNLLRFASRANVS